MMVELAQILNTENLNTQGNEHTVQYISHYRSPIGEILLATDRIGLTGLWFIGQKYFASNLEKRS